LKLYKQKVSILRNNLKYAMPIEKVEAPPFLERGYFNEHRE
jgi:hypothetical protein